MYIHISAVNDGILFFFKERIMNFKIEFMKAYFKANERDYECTFRLHADQKLEGKGSNFNAILLITVLFLPENENSTRYHYSNGGVPSH